MALDIDPFAVLRSIGAHQNCFPDIVAEVTKAARDLVVKQISLKNVGLETVRGVRKALGAESFELILDGIPDQQIKTLVGKLDKSNPQLKTSLAPWHREHLRGLVSGSVHPTVKISKEPPLKSSSRTKRKGGKGQSEGALELIRYRSAGVTRKR